MTGKELPSKIEYPRNLQMYKLEGAPSNSPGCSILSPGEHLRVVFNPPAEGDVLDICADGDDEYEAEVQYTDGHRETVKVPVQKGYGLARRILALDNPEGKSRVYAITIRPVAGDGKYSVGHVYVYKDNW